MTRRKGRVKVAHVVHRLDVGGLERVVINLMNHLSPDRYESSLYCLREGGSLTGELADAGYAVHELYKKEGVDYRLFFKIAWQFGRERIDIVHCHNIGALIYGSVGGKLARVVGSLYTAHGTYNARKLGQLRFSKFFSVDRIIAVSDESRAAMLENGRIQPQDVVTFPNGIDTDSFDLHVDVESIKRELGIPSGTTVLGVVARLSWEKQHTTLLDSVARLISKSQNVTLLVIGDGPLKDELHQYVSDLGLDRVVFFLGERQDVPRLLQIFDVFVLSSKMEGMSMSLLEAMAAGLPIVATDVGGNSEVVSAGETGILVEPDNPTALAEAVEQLLAEPNLARTMGERGRKRVNQLFSVRAMVERYETVYEEILGAV